MRWPSSGDGVRKGCPPTTVHRKGKTSNSSAEAGRPTTARVAAAKRDARLFWYARMCHPAIQAANGRPCRRRWHIYGSTVVANGVDLVRLRTDLSNRTAHARWQL